MSMKQRAELQQQSNVHIFHIEREKQGGAIPEEICRMIENALESTELTEQVIIAIDGVCGGGKSTLGQALARKYDCNLFHMDDFFLRPEQRNPERYAQAGGNVDYERFQSEILEHLADKAGLTYRPFDCSTMKLGEPRTVPYRRLNIIEGSYSCHPCFGDIYQVRFFTELSAGEQQARILVRNGEEKYRRFVNEWIPMENQYFEAYGIRDKCIRISLL